MALTRLRRRERQRLIKHMIGIAEKHRDYETAAELRAQLKAELELEHESWR